MLHSVRVDFRYLLRYFGPRRWWNTIRRRILAYVCQLSRSASPGQSEGFSCLPQRHQAQTSSMRLWPQLRSQSFGKVSETKLVIADPTEACGDCYCSLLLKLDPSSPHRYRNASRRSLPFAIGKSRHPLCATLISSLDAKHLDFDCDRHLGQVTLREYFGSTPEMANLLNLLSVTPWRWMEARFVNGIERHLI